MTFHAWDSKKIQRLTCDDYLNKLSRPWVLGAIYQYSASNLFLEKKIFKSFYHTWAWRPSCSMARNHSNTLSIPFRQKAPWEIWWKLLKWFQRGRRLKTRWRLWRPSWISDRHNLSYFRFKGNPVATVQVSTQITQWFRKISQKLVFKMAAVAAILDSWSAKFYILLVYN